jgi:triacylglycerol lipase
MTRLCTRSVFASARAVVLVAAYATLLPAWAAGCAGGSGSWSDPPDGGGPADAATLDASGPDDGDVVVCDPELAGDFVPQGEVRDDTWRTVAVPACRQTELFVVAAGGQALRLDLRGLTSPVQIAVFDALGTQVASGQVTDVEGGIDFTADTTGEYRVRISCDVAPTPGTYEVRLLCTDQCDLEATRYPIVLVHGAGGADTFGLLDYFFEAEANLQSYGYLPFAPGVSAMAHSEVRAQELAVAIDGILADTGAGKVHLIGHSQAGLDFRVLLGGLGYGDRVATATSVSTPHAGYRPGLAMGSVWFGMATDADYINGEFAALYPDDPAVPCFSWAAATCAAYDLACLARYDDEVVAAALATTYQTLLTAYLDDSHGGDNDGVVPVSATQWGTFLGILPADHWDVVGQVPGQRLGLFDHLEHYLSEARRLRALELDLEL